MLNVLQAENRILDFHTRNNSDEMFYCIEGEFDIEFEDGLTHLCESDFIIIPNQRMIPETQKPMTIPI